MVALPPLVRMCPPREPQDPATSPFCDLIMLEALMSGGEGDGVEYEYEYEFEYEYEYEYEARAAHSPIRTPTTLASYCRHLLDPRRDV